MIAQQQLRLLVEKPLERQLHATVLNQANCPLELSINLECSQILHSSISFEDAAEALVEQLSRLDEQELSLTKTRITVNLALCELMLSNIDSCFSRIQKLVNELQTVNNRFDTLPFVSFIFKTLFGIDLNSSLKVEPLSSLPTPIIAGHCLIAASTSFFANQQAVRILSFGLEQFRVTNARQMMCVCLQGLLVKNIVEQDRRKIKLQYSSALVESGLQIRGFLPVVDEIVRKLIKVMNHRIETHKQTNLSWQIVLAVCLSRAASEPSLQPLIPALKSIRNQTDPIIIAELSRTPFYKQSEEFLIFVLKRVASIVEGSIMANLERSLKALRDNVLTIQTPLLLSKNSSLGISIISKTQMSNALSSKRKQQKCLKFCQHGSFLNKRNFSSEGGQGKFFKLTSAVIKWGRTPEKVDDSGQLYPLKDVRGIVYGKATPNFSKNTNQQLAESLCFSFLLKSRTLDLCCKDVEELECWVLGASLALSRCNSSRVKYTPGKLRWLRMFAILREAFTSTLPRHKRNCYYYQNAYAIILFAKNGYKLPEKK